MKEFRKAAREKNSIEPEDSKVCVENNGKSEKWISFKTFCESSRK